MHPNRFAALTIPLSLAALNALPVAAQSPAAIATDSAVYLERIESDASRSLQPAQKLVPGDRVVTVVRWYRMGGDGGFVITNPLPASLVYEKSASNTQEVSVDGGRTWGRLADLRVNGHDATPEDVTHVRWRIPASLAARGRGEIAYAGIVR